MDVETRSITATGVGKPDYREGVEFSGEPGSVRGSQARYASSAYYAGLATPPFGTMWLHGLLLPQPDGTWSYVAPSTPHHIHRVSHTTDRVALALCGYYQFASYNDFLAAIIENTLGITYGYGYAELSFTKGIPTIEGKVYAVGFAEYSALATFNAHVNAHALFEEVLHA
jgi:hypothetical protein